MTDYSSSSRRAWQVVAIAWLGGVSSLLGQGQIIYTGNADGTAEIYSMSSNGTGKVRLTNNSAFDSYACSTPDGKKIIFVSDRTGTWALWSMNANGTGQTQLTSNDDYCFEPSISVDGKKITYATSNPLSGDFEIFVMNADGSNQTNVSNSGATEDMPSFSPDGTKIVFQSYRDGNGELYVMNVNGSNVVRLTNTPGTEWGPSFSPDGTKIVFSSDRDGDHEIFVMNANGSNQTRLTSNTVLDYGPSWSPDGRKIAFMSYRTGTYDVFIMNADGSNPVRRAETSPEIIYGGGTNWGRNAGVSINDVTLTEGNSGTKTAVFTVKMAYPMPRAAKMNFQTVNGTATAGSDFVGRSTTELSFAPGTVSRTISVTVNGDTAAEGNETFQVKLFKPVNAALKRALGKCTITNDD